MPKRFLSDGEQAQEPRRSGRRSGGRTSASESLGDVGLEAAILRRTKEAELKTARRIAALKQQEIDLQIDLAEKELEVEQARAAEELASASSAVSARSSAVDTSSSEPESSEPESSEPESSEPESSEPESSEPESSELESEDVDGGSWPRGVGSRRARSDAEAKRRLANHFSRSAFSDAGAGAVAHRRPGLEQGSGSQPAQQPIQLNMQQPVQPAVLPNTSAPVPRASLLKYRPAPTPAPRAKPRRLPAKPVPPVPLRLGPVQQAFKPKGAGPSPPPKPVPPVPVRLRPVQQAFKPKEAGLNPAAEPYFPPTRATDPAVDWADGAAMFQMGVCRSLKPLDLPKFDGKMLSYVKWRQRFLRLVHENPLLSEDYKLAHLREALADGAAEDLIADVLDGPGAYSAIMEELDRWYGGTDRSLEQQERELMSWPQINTERELDELKTLAVKLRSHAVTRRSVLSGLASAFDPRGQIAPFTIRARVLLQDTWLLDQAWDDELPPTHARKWREWFDELPDLAAINAPRSFKAATESILSVHTFTDASDRAIAAATYIRAEDAAGNVRVTLAMAKAKTAPARRQTIPQLELRGAVLGLRTSSEVGNALDIPVAEHTFWTDSMNVLGWIRSHSRRFKVDIGNRVSELQNATKPSQWRHVPGKQNPADKGTRGLPAKELAEDRVWWHGPAFLSQQPDVWPPEKSASTEGLPGVIQRETTFALAVTPTTRLQASRYRTWEQLLRVTAWCYRFVSRCRRKPRVGMKGEDTSSDQDVTVAVSTSRAANPNYPTVNVPELTAGEVGRAERHWIRQAQKDAYGPTLERLAAGKPMQASDPLAALNPTLDQHAEPLMVVGGRLKAAKHLPYRVRLPIILPQKHVVTRLLIEKEDRRCRHSVGPQHLLSNLRERFWIVNGASAVKTARQSCVPCRKNWGVPAAQIMGALPDFRTAGSLRPFSHCGIDFAGPFQTKQGRGRTRAKRYLCLMTCLETRACHLELTYSMDTGGFLMAFNRFVKRRGTPSIIVTDNGSNFVAAERELREAVEQLDRAEIARSLADRHIRWRFNPPRAPHFGGVFEAMIKAAKRALRSALATAELTDEELHTAIVAAEDLINSRPLTTVSADAADLEPLTPQHFLAGRCDPPLPLEEKLNATEQVHPRDRFAVVQRTVKEVWRRWLLEFVPLLNQRRKWRKTQKNIAVDEVVLCIEPDTPRGSWPLGRVRRVFPGPDSCVRVVDVEIRGKIYRRAIQRLIPLPVE